ncbi:MAG: MFS transporter [Chloroflexi bacterium]|nr:MFS transporter [Chloroflexota bacterium]
MKRQRGVPLIESRPRFFYGYVIVLAAFLFQLLAWGMWGTFPVFFEAMLSEFDWTRAATSGAFSLYLLVTAPVCAVMGRLNDRVGPRIIATICGLALGLGYVLTAQIAAIWQLYLFYGVLLGIGMSGYIAVNSTVARWFARRRGLAVGIVSAGSSMGLVVIPAPAMWLLSAYGWRNSYVIIGVITVVLVVVLAQLLRRDPGQMGLSPYGGSEVKEENVSLQLSGLSFPEAVRTRQLWMFIAVLVSLFMSYSSTLVHVVIHATGVGVPAASAARILIVVGMLGIVGGITMGSAVDRIGARVALAIVGTLVVMASLWLLVADSAWMFYLFGVLFGFAYGGLWALGTLTVAEIFGLKAHGAILGFATFIGLVGESVGPALAGYIFDVTSGYQLMFVITAVISAMSVILALLLRPIRKSAQACPPKGGSARRQA